LGTPRCVSTVGSLRRSRANVTPPYAK